jgi:hypothetical protein
VYLSPSQQRELTLRHPPPKTVADLVVIYPHFLWAEPNSPLAFLASFRHYQYTVWKDQFFAPEPVLQRPSFVKLYAVWEAVIHLPVSFWAVHRLLFAKGKGVDDGPAELLLLFYGLETVMTTATWMWEMWLWDEDLVTFDEKMALFGPYGWYLGICELVPASISFLCLYHSSRSQLLHGESC